VAAAGRAGFLLAATVLGFLAGSALPPSATRLAHPLVVCAAVANVGVAALGAVTGTGYLATLRTFLTKARAAAAAGPSRADPCSRVRQVADDAHIAKAWRVSLHGPHALFCRGWLLLAEPSQRLTPMQCCKVSQ